MTDPVIEGLQRDLHATALGKSELLCDHHTSPVSISIDSPVLFEAIKIFDPNLTGYQPDERWQLDTARCSDCEVRAIEFETFGIMEVLVRLPVTFTNNVVSVDAPDVDNVEVIFLSSPAEGYRSLTVDQQLREATASDDHGLSRWARVHDLLANNPPDELRTHIERLIERSPEVPPAFE